MRNVLRRIAFGVLGTGMVVTMAAGAATATASAAVAAPHQAFQQSLVWPTVMKGAQGNRVRTIQYLLNQSGFAVDVDGKFGSKTESEVKEFQSVNHLKPDGVVRSETWEALILTVKQGAKGYAVKAVQDYLNRAYGASLKVDGDFGTATTKAVIKFQDTYKNKYKLMVDGIVGIATWHALVSERG